MIGIEFERQRVIGTPDLKWSDKFWLEVAKVAEASTLESIRNQKQRDGSKLKVNAKSTRDRKRRKGRPLLSLVDEKHRFTKGGQNSWDIIKFLPGNTGIVIAGATVELRKLVEYVTEKGYIGWLGLHTAGVRAVRALMRREVKRQFRKAAKKGSRTRR